MKKGIRKGQLYKRGKRSLALLLSVCLIGTMIPVTARAESGSTNTGLCEHHTEHTSECGYVAPVEGHVCEHVHDESCGYQEASECTHVHTEECGENGERCTHVHTSECGYAEEQACNHVHDEECGYVEASEGSPCTYVCDICGNQIESGDENLPETVEESAKAEENLQNADSKVISDWEWIDEWEIIDIESGKVLLPFVNKDNVASYDDIIMMLPTSVMANGEELSLGEWLCPEYPVETGAYEGEYVFEITLPESYVLADGSNLLHLSIVLGDSEGESAVVYGSEHSHCVCGATHTAIGNHQNEESLTWEPFTDASCQAGGNYYLEKDVYQQDSGYYVIPSGKTVNICLNGHTFYGGTHVFYVASGGELRITDCQGSGELFRYDTLNVNHESAVYIAANGKCCLYQGTLHGFSRLIENYGEFRLYDGDLAGNIGDVNSGGGIDNNSGGTVYMYGGKIENCYVYNDYYGGGGVFNAGTFYMSGGTITGCKITGSGSGYKNSSGSGFYNHYTGSFMMTGGSIINNTAANYASSSNSYGYGVYNYEGNMQISGNVNISGNRIGSNINANLLVQSSPVKITGELGSESSIYMTHGNGEGIIAKPNSGVAANPDCFHADDTQKKVGKDNAGNIVLVDGRLVEVKGTVKVLNSPLGNASISFSSDSQNASVDTNSSGVYSVNLLPGTYTVSMSTKTKETLSLGTLTISEGDGSRTVDYPLTKLTGTVKDSSGQGIAYAKASFGTEYYGYSDSSGNYTVLMPQNLHTNETSISVSAESLQYAAVTETVSFSSSGMTQDFTLTEAIDGDELHVANEADLVRLATFENILSDRTIVIDEDIALTGAFQGIQLSANRTLTIQGNDHTISGLTTPLFAPNTTNISLEGSVTNLHLRGDVSADGYYVGAFAIRGTGLTLDGCSFEGSIAATKETADIGGLLGKGEDNVTITNCYVSLDRISGTNNERVGGLCGYAYDVTIQNCYVRIRDIEITLDDNNGSLGGICGLYANSSVNNCYVVVTGNKKLQYALGYKDSGTVQNIYIQDGSADDYSNTTTLAESVMTAKAGSASGDSEPLVDRLNASLTTGWKKWNNGSDGYPCFIPPTYTITYSGGTKGTGSQDAQTVTDGQTLTLPGAVFKNADAIQKGWTTTENGEKVYELNDIITPTADMTLYPYWEAKEAASCTAPTGLRAYYGNTVGSISLPEGFTWNTPDVLVGDVGTHTFTATYTPTGEVAETYGKNTSVQISVEVKKAPSIFATLVSKVSDLTYNRTAQDLVTAGATADGTIVYSLTEDGTYTTSIPTATNSGNYTVYYKIQGDDNHEDSRVGEISVSIGKSSLADATITLGDALTYNGESQTQSIASVNVGNMILGVGDYTVTNNTGSAVGTYTLTVTGQGNFEGSATKDFKIAKKAAVSVPDIDKKYVYAAGSRGAAVSIDIASLLPNDRGVTTYSLATNSAEYVTEKAVGTDGILTYKVGTNGSVDDNTTLTVTASSDNYEDITVKVNIQIVDKYTVIEMESAKVAIAGSNTLTYGQMLSNLTLNTSAARFVEEGNPAKEVTGTLAWETPDAILNVGIPTAKWVFTPYDTLSYEAAEGYVVITVNKATPQVTALPTVTDRTYNPTVSLTDGDLVGGIVTGVDGNPLGGSWSWQTAGIIPTVNNNGYVAVFTPTDSTNYETVTKTITVTVSKATPYIKTAPTADTITYGDTLGDSAILGGTVQYSDNDATAVSGSFAWADATTKPTVADSDTTAYRAVYHPSDADNYNTAETDITLTVNKADNTPNMPSSTMNVANSCKKVSDVTLPTGWVWQDADKDTALAVDTPVTATAEYNGADKGNYENETVSVTITRSACDHVHTEIRNAKEATCKETGYTGDTYCMDCGALLSTGTTIPLADHQGGTATCTKKAVCTVCGKEYGTLDANNHAHMEIKGAVAATCTAGGYTGDTYCTDCGVKTKTGTVTPALGHNYTSKVTTEPTTEKEGVRTYTCDRCGHSYTESIPKLPEETHEHSYSGSVTKEPTCTDTGVRTYTCSCGDSYTETIPALGHHYISSVTKQPTTSSEGVKTYTCDRCGHSYTRAIAKLQDTNNNNPGENQPGDTKPGDNKPENNKPDTGKPYIKDENGKEGWDVINDEVDKTKDGDTVTVEMNGSAVVPGNVLDEIKGKDVDIVFDMGGGITWSVNGQSITGDDTGDIDFSVTVGTNTIPTDVINNVIGERYSQQISLAYDGEFGFTAVLFINMEASNAGLYANLFYFNEKTGELSFICADEIAEDGTAELTFTHASDYAIVIDKESMEGSVQVGSPASESQDTETESTQTGAEVSNDAWNPWWIIIIGIMVIVIGAGVFFVVKKREENEKE